jgi:hypothetical protein
MTLLLRAIVGAEDVGIGAELGLTVVPATAVAALASPWESAGAAGEADLLDHHRVIQAIFGRVPCLPARFGSVFPDPGALGARLVLRERNLATQLARLGHRCELAITCAWRDSGASVPTASVPASTGRA